MTIDEAILAVIRAEIARLVRPEALNDSAGSTPDDVALREQARAAAARLRRARRGGGIL
jgi:hypothetical protein